ncbi:unnamed protein product [Spirodela intermedia]|uniref:GAGA-binding transcriptional activator n=1 Tax=Spirodela intermedia TaxID=51605 RepID=A0A7I8IJC5_SPIIN|nr:unnamed protein product [Spirodela intermedia]CAA6657248.1 unnamed protein product [Spirodela intermedia]
MDGKARLGVRNWDFSGQQQPPRNVDPALKQPSPDAAPPHQQSAAAAAAAAQHAAFLKMSAYPDRHSVLAETNYGPMDFGWVPQRNFLAAPPKSDLNSSPGGQVNLEMAAAAPAAPPPGATSKAAKKQKKAGRVATKILQPKPPKKPPPPPRKKAAGSGSAAGKREKKNPEIALEGITFDFSGVPSPVCSCTGVPRQCYRWGAAGWQSSCCTTNISEYPLPMSTLRPGARLAGRKMSINAYGKLLQRLAVEGYDLSTPVDLKPHWARHGTNKFVTIR